LPVTNPPLFAPLFTMKARRIAGARRYGASKISGDNNDMQETAFIIGHTM
jgi:hypothetical protein